MKNSLYRVVEDQPVRKGVYAMTFVLTLLLVLVSGFLAGQWRAQQAISENAILRVALSETQDAEQELRNRIVDAELSLATQKFAVTDMRVQLTNMHGERAELLEELGFFRNLMTSDDGPRGLRVGDFDLYAGEGPSSYNFVILVTQAAKVRRLVSGQASLVVRGILEGNDAQFSLTELGTDKEASLDFRFRYFQDLAGVLNLPENFVPQVVIVTVRTKKGPSVDRSFPWAVEEA
jgi:hypothetical protein|tara:strand:+ start:6404 stop:7105 length:702 start_codon:yes stop_codon:yes gene_type:complete